MRILCGTILAAALAANGAEQAELRGFGRVSVNHEIHKIHEKHAVSVMRFECETPGKAEVVLGKFLWDLRREPDVVEKDGIFSRPGAAFAFAKEGSAAIIYAADDMASLEDWFSRKERKGRKDVLVEKAECPDYMRGFG